MALYLVSSVSDDGVDEHSFRLVDAESVLAVAQAILDDPFAWESLIQNTDLWWDLTRYEDKYGEPLDWTPEDLLEKIAATWVDGGSRNEVRIQEIGEIEHIPPRPLQGKRICS